MHVVVTDRAGNTANVSFGPYRVEARAIADSLIPGFKYQQVGSSLRLVVDAYLDEFPGLAADYVNVTLVPNTNQKGQPPINATRWTNAQGVLVTWWNLTAPAGSYALTVQATHGRIPSQQVLVVNLSSATSQVTPLVHHTTDATLGAVAAGTVYQWAYPTCSASEFPNQVLLTLSSMDTAYGDSPHDLDLYVKPGIASTGADDPATYPPEGRYDSSNATEAAWIENAIPGETFTILAKHKATNTSYRLLVDYYCSTSPGVQREKPDSVDLAATV